MTDIATSADSTARQLAGEESPDVFRLLSIALVAIGSIGLSLSPSNCAADTVKAAATEPLKVIVLPARVHVARAGFVKYEEVGEWTEAARTNVEKATADAIVQATAFSLVPLPVLSADELGEIEEFIAVANLATTQFGGFSLFGEVKVQRTAADRVLGSSLAFLNERTGADYAIGAFAFQLEQSKRLAALGATVGLGMFAGGGIVALPPVTFSYVALFIADLRTGELRWSNVENGYEVAGLNFSDLRDAESVAKTIAQLLEKYPEVSWPTDRKELPEGGLGRPVSPKQGEFAVQVPAGWRTSDDVNMIRATHDGRALNEMKIELRNHDRAFPASGGKATRSSSPEELAEAFVADLGKQGLADLEIIDVSTDAQLAGKTAFRVGYRYRLPMFCGGARIEIVAIGTSVPRGLLIAQLDAPRLRYFDKALPVFEEAVQSIVLKPRRHLH